MKMHLYKDKDVYKHGMHDEDTFDPQTKLLLTVLFKTVVKSI